MKKLLVLSSVILLMALVAPEWRADLRAAGPSPTGGVATAGLLDAAWQLLTPDGASITSIEPDASDPQHMFAATSTGWIYATTDGGSSWSRDPDVGYDDPVVDLAYNAAKARLYHLTVYGHLRSSGPGNVVDMNPGMSRGRAVAMDPVTPAIVYALGDKDGALIMAKTSNDGYSWSNLDLSVALDGEAVGMAIAPSRPSTLYVAGRSTAGGPIVLRSSDGGASWGEYHGTLPRPPVAIVADRLNDMKFYVLDDQGRVSRFPGIDGNWTALGQAPGAQRLVQDPATPSTFYAIGGGRAYISLDSCLTWTPLGSAPADSCVDILSRPGRLIVAGNEGYFTSDDGGLSWTPRVSGMKCVEVRAVAVAPTPVPTIYYRSNGPCLMKSIDRGLTWTRLPAPGGEDAPARLLIDPAAPQTVFFQNADVLYRSADGGTTWTVSKRKIGIFTVCPGRPRLVYAVGPSATGRLALFKSSDQGRTWSSRRIPSMPGEYFALAVRPENAACVWYSGYDASAQANRLLKTVDGGASWISRAPANERVYDVAPHPQSPGTVYASFWGSLRRSVDGGSTWTRIYPPRATRIFLDPARPGRIYSAADRVFFSSDAGLTWSSTPDYREAGPVTLDLPNARFYQGGPHGLWTLPVVSRDAVVVSGTIRRKDGTGVAVPVDFPGLGTSTPAADGTFIQMVPRGWSGTIAPVMAGETFVPPSRAVSGITADRGRQDFAATSGPTVSFLAPAEGQLCATTIPVHVHVTGMEGLTSITISLYADYDDKTDGYARILYSASPPATGAIDIDTTVPASTFDGDVDGVIPIMVRGTGPLATTAFSYVRNVRIY